MPIIPVPVAAPSTEPVEVQLRELYIRRSTPGLPGYTYAALHPVNTDGNWDPNYLTQHFELRDDPNQDEPHHRSLHSDWRAVVVGNANAEVLARLSAVAGEDVTGYTPEEIGTLLIERALDGTLAEPVVRYYLTGLPG